MALLSLDRVSKRYRRGRHEVVALEDVSFDLHPGEFAAIFGRRAAGKTTLLRIAAGIEPTDSGIVCFASEDITTWAGATVTLPNLWWFYRRRIRARIVQELFAMLGIAVGVALLFAVQVSSTSLSASIAQLTHGLVGDAQYQLVARTRMASTRTCSRASRRSAASRRRRPCCKRRRTSWASAASAS